MKPLLIDEIKVALRAELKTANPHSLIKAVSIDSRTIRPGELFVAIRGENFDGHDFIDQAIENGAPAVIVERNLPLSDLAKRHETCIMKVTDTLEALGELAKFYRRSLGHQITVIAVTGSNGKTTTRRMIHHVLSTKKPGYQSPANFNNQIGLPLTILATGPEHEFVVVEMGSSEPGEIEKLSKIAAPDIAVITNIGRAHLEKLKDLAGVSREKTSIVTGLQDRGVVICSNQHAATLEKVRSFGKQVISFGVDGPADVSATQIQQQAGKLTFLTNDRCPVALALAGRHNVSNALAALAVSRRMGLTSLQFAEAIKTFEPAKGRFQYMDACGITIIDDSYNANPDSMAAAVAELIADKDHRRKIIVIGEMCELGEDSPQIHRELGRLIAQSPISVMFAIGPMAAGAAGAAIAAGMARGDVQCSVSSKRLARLIKSSLRDGDIILVKGSRAMQTEQVVESLKRYKGGRPKVN